MISNDKGFSLVSVLLAAGLTAGIALTIARISDNALKVQLDMKNSMVIANSTNEIEKYLLKPANCKIIVNDGGGNFIHEKNYSRIRVFNRTAFTVGQTIPGSNVQISKFYGARDVDNNIEFYAHFLKEGKGNGARSIIKKFKVQATFDTGGGVTKCFSMLDGAVEAACSTLGGTMDASSNCTNGSQCNFETQILRTYGGQTHSCNPNVGYLKTGSHTFKDCTDKGGTVREAEMGTWVCEIQNRNCPAGWVNHSNWGSTTGASQKCGTDRKGGSCFGGRCASISSAGWGQNNESNKSYGDDKCKVGCTCGGVKPNGPYYVYSYYKSRACF